MARRVQSCPRPCLQPPERPHGDAGRGHLQAAAACGAAAGGPQPAKSVRVGRTETARLRAAERPRLAPASRGLGIGGPGRGSTNRLRLGLSTTNSYYYFLIHQEIFLVKFYLSIKFVGMTLHLVLSFHAAILRH